MLNEITTNKSNANEQLFFSSTAQSLLSAELKDEHFLNCLMDNHCFSDAIAFLSHSLNCKDGITWARACVSQYSQNLSTNDNYLLSSTANWLQNPSDRNRQCVLPKKVFEQSTPACWVALSAYWSEGSIVEDKQEDKEIPKQLVNEAIYSAIMLLMQQTPEDEKYGTHISVINDGIDILINSRAN